MVAYTPHKGNTKSAAAIAPDCGVYPHAHRPQIEDATGRLDWSYMEITFECKVEVKDDPFDDTSHNCEPISQSGKSTLDQLLCYAELVFHNQHRAFQFMVIFLGTLARIIRIDRFGIFATDRFNYRTQEKKLTEFLWRYARLSAAQRGHDNSATRINPSFPRDDLVHKMWDKLKEAKGHVADIFNASLSGNGPWWKLQVPDEKTGKIRWYVVGKPHFQAPGVNGRGTRCYIAVELHENGTLGDFVYLKDVWRVKHDDIEKEGTTLNRLNEGKVPNVPTLVCHSELPNQLTQSSAKWREFFPPERSHCPLNEHQHYRLIVKEIGKPLSQFTNSAELIKALLHILEGESCVCAFSRIDTEYTFHPTAHKAACDLHIIHRDISPGNVLLVQDEKGEWKGMLTDWELAKDTERSTTRQLERTVSLARSPRVQSSDVLLQGTWQFMSALLQNNPRRAVAIPDELESVFHVIIFYSVRFLHHTLSDSDVGPFLYAYFDASPLAEDTVSLKLMAMKTGRLSLEGYRIENSGNRLRFIWPSSQPPAVDQTPPAPDYAHPLNDIVEELLEWFEAHYALADVGPDPAPKEAPIDRTNLFVPVPMESGTPAPRPFARSARTDRTARVARNLETHEPMMDLLRRALARGWPLNDKTKDKRPKDGFNPDRDPESSSCASSSSGGSDLSEDVPFAVLGGDILEDDGETDDDPEGATFDVEEDIASGPEDDSEVQEVHRGKVEAADHHLSSQPIGPPSVPASSSSIVVSSVGFLTGVMTRSSRKRRLDEPVSPKRKRSRRIEDS